MMESLKNRLHREAFLITPLSIVINPIYIIRNGLFKSIARIAPTIKGDVLDFGCGSKPYESLFTNVDSYIGIDIENSGHDHNDSKIDLFYDGKVIPFPDNHFDAVVCFEVLEHVVNINEVLTEIRRILKPNGLFLVSIPFAWEEHEIPYDYARYTSYGIKHMFISNRYEVLELNKTTTYILAVSQMFIIYLFQFVLPKGRFWRGLSQLLIIFPLNVLSLFLNMILPKRYEYFCNCLILSRKLPD